MVNIYWSSAQWIDESMSMLCFPLQFFLIAAYLSKSGDVEEWLKLAMMSLEQNNFGQALTCYNQGNLN